MSPSRTLKSTKIESDGFRRTEPSSSVLAFPKGPLRFTAMATGLWSGEEANRSGQLSIQSAAWPAGARASEGGSLMNGCLIPWPLSGHPGFYLREG